MEGRNSYPAPNMSEYIHYSWAPKPGWTSNLVLVVLKCIDLLEEALESFWLLKNMLSDSDDQHGLGSSVLR